MNSDFIMSHFITGKHKVSEVFDRGRGNNHDGEEWQGTELFALVDDALY